MGSFRSPGSITFDIELKKPGPWITRPRKPSLFGVRERAAGGQGANERAADGQVEFLQDLSRVPSSATYVFTWELRYLLAEGPAQFQVDWVVR